MSCSVFTTSSSSVSISFISSWANAKTELVAAKTKNTASKRENFLIFFIAFRNVSNMPARVKCALLAWHTIEDMLNKNNSTGTGNINCCQ
mgnify:CR=1 FL=1